MTKVLKERLIYENIAAEAFGGSESMDQSSAFQVQQGKIEELETKL